MYNTVMTPEEQNKVPPVPQNTQPQQSKGGDQKTAYKVFSVLLVIAGILTGVFVGFFVSFNACYKSDCSPVENYAPFWIPVATLLFTIPVVYKAFKK